jgi:putative ABC transport system permease protein
MIANYLKIAFRITRKSGTISLLNIIGLSAGMAVCIIIFLYVRYELSFDRYHKDYRRIYRIEQQSNKEFNGARQATLTNFIGLAIEKMDEVEALGRIWETRSYTVRYGDNAYKEDNILSYDPGMFRIFSYEFTEGSSGNDFTRPNTAILTESMRRKYFGEKEAMGKLIRIDTVWVEIVGVIKDPPFNSHFRPDLILSRKNPFTGFDEMPEEVTLFGMHVFTYVKLLPNTLADRFAARILNLPEKLEGDRLKKNGEVITCHLDPLSDVHLNSEVVDDRQLTGNRSLVYLILMIGVLVLVTTCLNYMNLSTARFINRFREIGIRKTFGANKAQMVVQFMGESLFLVFIAYFLAMALVETGLIFINSLLNVNLDVKFSDPGLLAFTGAVVILTGIVAALYPVYMISFINPSMIEKEIRIPGRGGYNFRSAMVVAQFMISISLIIATLMISRQMDYLKNSSSGFMMEQKLVFQLPEGKAGKKNFESIKQEFMKNTGVTGTTISSSVPGRWLYNWALWPTGKKATNSQIINCMQADFDYFRLYGLEIIGGEGFEPGSGSEGRNGVIINETAMKAFGWNNPDEAIKNTLMEPPWGIKIRGVCKDFHFKGKNQKIGPFAFFHIGEDYRYITLEFTGNAVSKVLTEARITYGNLFPDAAEDYFFLDTDFEKQYEKEQTTYSLVLIFTIFAILIACLGLYGMTVYTLENKKHKYGIMKVNGASSAIIYSGILKEFLFRIGIAFVIVTPIMSIAGKKWLEQFPYRADLTIWIYIYAGLILAGITIITITLETYKIFRLNPADIIRNE